MQGFPSDTRLRPDRPQKHTPVSQESALYVQNWEKLNKKEPLSGKQLNLRVILFGILFFSKTVTFHAFFVEITVFELHIHCVPGTALHSGFCRQI